MREVPDLNVPVPKAKMPTPPSREPRASLVSVDYSRKCYITAETTSLVRPTLVEGSFSVKKLRCNSHVIPSDHKYGRRSAPNKARQRLAPLSPSEYRAGTLNDREPESSVALFKAAS